MSISQPFRSTIVSLSVFFFFFTLLYPMADLLAEHNQQSVSIEKTATTPLVFTQNLGQWDDKVKFRANAGGVTMWFASDGAYYQFTRTIKSNDGAPLFAIDKRCRMKSDGSAERQQDSIETIMIKVNFVGSNANPIMRGVDMLEYKCNYFIGNDPHEWRTDVPNYTAVLYEEIYDGIDLKYYGNGKQMEYDFIVSPGSDFSQVSIQYEGAKSLSVNADGELVVETEWGEVIEKRPVVYQVINGAREEIDGQYALTDDNTFSFSLGANIDPTLPLTIDPVLEYSTYLGGGNDDQGFGISVDNDGNAYVAGSTFSANFPNENPYQTYQGDRDVFLTKLSSTGSSLIYSTYIGGGDEDYCYGLSVDVDGNAYVTGYTYSTDFPTENPYLTDQADRDGFVTKLNSSGNGLIYSSYLGGGGDEAGHDVIADASGDAYVTGWTSSVDFPTANPYQSYPHGSTDVFVTKMSSAGSLLYSTYLGGVYSDWGERISVDVEGNAYVTGGTESTDFPIENPYQTDQDTTDAFVIKLNSSGNGLIYSTYLGGTGHEVGIGISVDASGNAYVTGVTESIDFPTENPYQTYQGNGDGYVAKLSSAGNSLVYSTFLGGADPDASIRISVDGSGNAYVAGFTESIDFPTENPYQTDQDTTDAFVTKLSSTGNSLIYSTYLGGGDIDWGIDIYVDIDGNAYVTGYTESTDFPTEIQYQTDQGYGDVFVTKFLDPSFCCTGMRGNANGDPEDKVNITDITYLIQYLFGVPTGPAPVCNKEANANGDPEDKINITDITYLIQYLFGVPSGPVPPACP